MEFEIKIYVLIDPRTNMIRYVGQTRKSLEYRLYQHINDFRKSHRANWILTLLRENLKPIIKQIDIGVGQEQANILEKFWIKKYREENIPLTNYLGGGQGGPTMLGKSFSSEHKRKMSIKQKDKIISDWHKQKVSQAQSEPVMVYDKNDIFIGKFNNKRLAEKQLGIKVSTISKLCISGERSKKRGYKFISIKKVENGN